MGYILDDVQLVAALHALRWHKKLPKEVNGLNSNLVLEAAVDRILFTKEEDKQSKGGE
jgi:hypothetical protein